MTQAVSHPEPAVGQEAETLADTPADTLYDTDFHAWTQQQARLLRSGDIHLAITPRRRHETHIPTDAFDRLGLLAALESIGAAVANSTRLDLAIYGGRAFMLASNFRFATEDVDVARICAKPSWLEALLPRSRCKIAGRPPLRRVTQP